MVFQIAEIIPTIESLDLNKKTRRLLILLAKCNIFLSTRKRTETKVFQEKLSARHTHLKTLGNALINAKVTYEKSYLGLALNFPI